MEGGSSDPSLPCYCSFVAVTGVLAFMRFNNPKSARGGRESTQPLPSPPSCSSSTSDGASIIRCGRIFASPPDNWSTTNRRKIPAKSNQEIRGTFKHNKNELARELRSATFTETPPGYLRTQSDCGDGGAIGGGGWSGENTINRDRFG